MTREPPSIARLRARLVAQVAPPLAVSERGQQYVFDEEHAAYNEIDIKRGDDFVIAVVLGSLPSEAFVVKVWHRYASEVWLVDTRDEQVYVAQRDEAWRVLGRGDTLRSDAVPAVAIPIAGLFVLPS